MLGITGATGQVGREVVHFLNLKKKIPKLLVRDLKKGESLQGELTYFDFSCPETYAEALEEVKVLFLVVTKVNADLERFLSFCSKSEVEFIVLMSGMGADHNPNHFLAQAEAAVRKSGIPFTALRANWFFQNFGSMFLDAIKQGELALPAGEAKLSFVDVRDVAEVAVQLLLNWKQAKPNYVLTGEEALSHHEVCAIISKYLGRPVAYRSITDKEALELFASQGWNQQTLLLFEDMREGIVEPIFPDVREMLGKPARRFDAFAKDLFPFSFRKRD